MCDTGKTWLTISESAEMLTEQLCNELENLELELSWTPWFRCLKKARLMKKIEVTLWRLHTAEVLRARGSRT